MIAQQQRHHQKATRPASGLEPSFAAPVCRFEDLPIGIGVAFVVRGRSIAVFRTRGDSVRAVDNACPHRGGPLADGIIAGQQVVCPLHAYRYDLCDGSADVEGRCGVTAYETRVAGGWVFLKVPP